VKAVVSIAWFSMPVDAMKSGAAYRLAFMSEIKRFFSTWAWPIAWQCVKVNVDQKNGTISSKKPALA
jgi:hypothetical protein